MAVATGFRQQGEKAGASQEQAAATASIQDASFKIRRWQPAWVPQRPFKITGLLPLARVSCNAEEHRGYRTWMPSALAGTD